MAGTDLRLGLMIRIFAVLAVATVAALAIAPAKSVFTEWRTVQERYNSVAAKPAPVGIQQVWNEKLGIVDRCVSCHLPAGGAAAVPGDPFFTAHPEIPHEPAEFGCTLCHGGQGRATTKEAAHGETLHWEVPLLDTDHLAAGCGSCHSGVRAGSPLSDRGGELLDRYDCLACHRLNGRGGGRAAPDVMADLGAGGAAEGWHARHLRMKEDGKHPLFAECYGEIPPDAVVAISERLMTLSGMPALEAGRRAFLARGCRGCHKVNGVGGSEGAELTLAGAKAHELFEFPRGWSGDETAYAWHVAHLLSPAEVVPESLMPDQGLSRQEAEQVALYLLSLRKADVPMDYWPPDRIRVDRLGERDFPGDGRSLYAGFCSACHGESGEGRPFGVHGEEYPAVASPDLLAIATDDFLVKTILSGRPGRRMPGFGPVDGGLTEDEVRGIVRWLRTAEPAAPTLEAVRAASPDARLGRETYEQECSVCHGADRGGDVGPSLDSPAFRELARDRFVLETVSGGRPGTSMPAFRELDARTLASLFGYLGVVGGARPEVRMEAADPRRGGEVYAASCASCHGPDGEGGGRAPGIGRRGFFKAADLAFVVGSYERERCRDAAGAPPSPLPAADLASAAAWLEERAGTGGAESLLPRVEGDLALGKNLYGRACAGCHGADGAGKEAPALSNAAFLSAASDAYIRTTIVRGRRGTAMPRFDADSPKHRRLGAREIDAITAYVRSFARPTKEDDQ